MQQISTNQVVQFHYTVRNEQGEILESSRGQQALTFLYGHGNLIPGLEKAMLNKSSGDQFSVTLPPEDAYGPVREGMEQKVSVKHLSGARKWKPGMLAVLDTAHGPQQVRIISIGKFMAEVDFNHPQAGQTLNFDVDIISVREASPEELAHGHVHGAGGHHH
ncbi:MAG: peptidylprolyl isomerase [Pseudomonadales bacterium]|nr:peptidylprolyl isomerase [Pseudomonadales bacterium]